MLITKEVFEHPYFDKLMKKFFEGNLDESNKGGIHSYKISSTDTSAPVIVEIVLDPNSYNGLPFVTVLAAKDVFSGFTFNYELTLPEARSIFQYIANVMNSLSNIVNLVEAKLKAK